MDLTTRCPNCGSTFSVSLEQLQLRKGFVRCINCAHIFDAYEAVVPGEAQAASPAPAARAPTAPPPSPGTPSVVRQRQRGASTNSRASTSSTLRAQPPVAQFVPKPDSLVDSSTATGGGAQRAEPVISSVYSDRLEHDAQAPEPRIESTPIYATREDDGFATDDPIIHVDPRRHGAIDETELLPDFLDNRRERGRGFVRFFWSVLIGLGLALLLAQAAYVYRVQIASAAPALRPVLEKACVSLHCKVSYSRRIELISIMNSSLRSNAKTTDTQKNPNQMILQVTLRNNDQQAQEWPVLTLDLVDFSGTVVAKKNLAPNVYLSPDVFQKPFAGKSEIVATVPITLNGIKINGFQLGKFFP